MSTRRPHVVFALAFLTACAGGDSPTDPGPGTPGPPTIASVTVSPAGVTIPVGGTQIFAAAVRDSNGSNVTNTTVTWSSTNSSVATVTSNGLALGIAEGTAAITATVSGVEGSQNLTVEFVECSTRLNVAMDPGGSATYEASDCLLLPPGASGDRYRVAVIRTSESENPTGVTTATVKAMAIGASSSAVAQPSGPAAVPAQEIAKIDGTVFVENFARRQQTARVHAILRQRERDMGFSAETLLRDRPLLAPDHGADPPTTRQINTTSTCSGEKTSHSLVTFNADLAIYQDDAGTAVDVPSANAMLEYYSLYVKDMLAEYWGPIPDVDGNGRLLVTTADSLSLGGVAEVFSGDLQNASACANSNQAEIAFFQTSFFNEMADGQWAALGVLAHEAQHIIGFRNRALGGQASGPDWIEEGAADLSEEMAARNALAATGGPAITAPITFTDLLNAWPDPTPSKEVWGILDRIAGTIIQLTSHPNSFTTDPTGADSQHSFYHGSWHFQRFLADAYGNAGGGEAGAFFTALYAPTATPGTAGLTAQTGQSFEQLFVELATAMSLHGTGASEPARTFATYDFVSAMSIFGSPEELAPPGAYPWPVTTDPITGNPSAAFVTATYSGSMGVAGIRIHDFISSGTGEGLQLVFGVAAPAKIVVTRLR